MDKGGPHFNQKLIHWDESTRLVTDKPGEEFWIHTEVNLQNLQAITKRWSGNRTDILIWEFDPFYAVRLTSHEAWQVHWTHGKLTIKTWN